MRSTCFALRDPLDLGDSAMKAHERFTLPATQPPGEFRFMVGGSADPAMTRAYGFDEAQLMQAAMVAYVEAFMDAPPGTARETLRAVMVGRFVDALEDLGA